PIPIPGNPLGFTYVYLVEGSEGPLLIDTGWNHDQSWQALLRAVERTGHTIEEVRGAVLTHFHRSEEHTPELQSRLDIDCRPLLQPLPLHARLPPPCPPLFRPPIPIPGNPLGFTYVYLVEGSEGPLLIDTGWNHDQSWQALLRAVERTGHTIEEVRGAVLTHFH